MVLDTTADVDEIEAVSDRDGNRRPAATADEQEVTNARLGNASTWMTETVSDDGTGSSATSTTVRDGFTVIYQASNDNGAIVEVDGIELKAGQSIAIPVSDPSIPTITAQSGTLEVTVGWFDA